MIGVVPGPVEGPGAWPGPKASWVTLSTSTSSRYHAIHCPGSTHTP